MNRNKGLTLVELIISMAIFLVLMGIVTKAFQNIVSFTGQTVKSAESDITGLVGLEIMRRDIEHAGFGLLWSYQTTLPAFKEVETADNFPIQGVKGETYNDPPPANSSSLESAAPRPLLCATTTTTNRIIDGTGSYLTNAGTDYLVVKSIPVGMNDATKHWTHVSYSGSSNSYLKRWGNQDDLKANDHVISLITSFSTDKSDNRTLAIHTDGSGNKSFEYKVTGTVDEKPPLDGFMPSDKSQNFTTYAVGNSTATSYLKMPYNRADYFIRKPAQAADFPQSCNPGTGILYKFIAGQGGNPGYPLGGQIPLLDCVGDMQVIFEMDTGPLDDVDINPLSAREMRERLRTVRIYLLTHEGKKDRNYTFHYSNASEVLVVGDPLLKLNHGRVWTATMMADYFGADWRNYRWKVLSIAVQPKNLYNQ